MFKGLSPWEENIIFNFENKKTGRIDSINLLKVRLKNIWEGFNKKKSDSRKYTCSTEVYRRLDGFFWRRSLGYGFKYDDWDTNGCKKCSRIPINDLLIA